MPSQLIMLLKQFFSRSFCGVSKEDAVDEMGGFGYRENVLTKKSPRLNNSCECVLGSIAWNRNILRFHG